MTGPGGLDPFELLCGLRLESGASWGEAAQDWQCEDAASVLAGDGPRRTFLLRGRGMSKTTDAAALALVLLLTQAPPRSRSYCYAVDIDQARIMIDTLGGFVARTPGLAGGVELGASSVVVRASGASLSIESSDGASAFGTRPWLTAVDELGAWPLTSNHGRLWSAIVSAVPKVPGSRLLVIGSAGSPNGIAKRAWDTAEASPSWRTSRRPGPSPWWSAEDVESTRASLTDAEWTRLIVCDWVESDDALSSAQDVAACIRPGSAVLPPRPGVRYVAALDVGTRRDLTALAIGHAEPGASGRVVVIDRIMYWRPGRFARVDLAEVEASALRLCREYRVHTVRFDRAQCEQLAQNLARAGLHVDEFVFSTAGVNRLARTVWTALRDGSVSLPDDEEVRAEFVATRLVETGPGTVKLANPPGQHDDCVVAAGMVLAELAGQPDGRGSVTVPGRHGRGLAGRSITSAARTDLARRRGTGLPPVDLAGVRSGCYRWGGQRR